MKKKDDIKLSGRIELCLIRDGKIIEREVKDNLVVTAGKTRTANLLGGTSTEYFNYIAIGTGTNEPAAGDTTLQTEVKREQATISNSSNQEIFEKTFDFGSSDSYAITELGIFSAASGGAMLDRLKFTAKNVDLDTSLYVKVTITVN